MISVHYKEEENMNFVFAFAVVALVFLIVAIVAYVYNSNSIIKTQEKQIARLRTENFRLQAALKRNVRTVRIYDNTIDPENISEYNNI